ncbi:MAG: tellurite resistance TerB family protein [Rhodospirillales bacterium]|nr:tellurite resistance TerB family protein [Rhodospirillales bacterium]
MFDARNLLDQLIGSGMSNSGRLSHALGPDGLQRAGGGLGDMLSGILSGGGAGGGALGDLAGKAQEMLGQGTDAVRGNYPLAIGGLGALAGALLGGGRGAVGGGVLAVLGSLAYSALSKQGGEQGTEAASVEDLTQKAPLEMREPQTVAEGEQLQNNALVILRAMINAAKADGTVDANEVQKIAGHLQQSGADGEAQQFVMTEMAKPMDTDGIVAAVDKPELAVEVYAASLLAIEVDTPAEREYIKDLAQRLGLAPEAVDEIHRALGVSI